MRILAIDPGLSGGVCIYAPQFSIASGMRWHLADIQTIGEGSQRRVDVMNLSQWIRLISPDCAFIEAVSAMPKQGVSSSFRFGRAAGAIDAVVGCCGIPITYISSRRWKKFHNLKGSDKEQSRQKCIQLAPELSVWLTLKRHHNRAEAALIAMYGEYVELREQAA